MGIANLPLKRTDSVWTWVVGLTRFHCTYLTYTHLGSHTNNSGRYRKILPGRFMVVVGVANPPLQLLLR
jgi:hypothetical protein